MTSPKVWFITGSSTGFGRIMTELVLAKGDIAVATLRSPEVLAELTSQYGKDRLLVLKLDVSKPQEIKDAFAAAVKQFGRVDNVLNNAGYAMIGEAETGPEDVARTMFEVNMWGAVNVSKEAVRIMREVNKPAGGRLLQISSMSGYMGLIGMSYYCASKHAISAFTESLSKELDPDWNIKVVIVEPGAFRTGGYGHVVWVPLHPAYEKVMSAPRKYLAEDVLDKMQDPVQAVDVLYKIAELPDPPLFLPLGKDSVSMATTRYAEMVENTKAVASWSEELRVMG